MTSSEHRRWWRNPPFWIALCLPPVVSYFAAQMGSNRAIERKQAAFEVTTTNLSQQFSSIRSDFARLSDRIDGRLGDIANAKAAVETQRRELDTLRTFMSEQNDYNFNVNKVMTEIVTVMRERGLPAPTIPKPPKLKGQ